MKVKEESEKAGLKLNIQKTKIITSGPIASWQIYGETMETVTHFIFLGCKITVDGDCSHGIKRHLLLGRRKATTNLDNILESITADFSIETLQVRKEWLDIPKVMKEKNLQPRLVYPARISFKFEGEIKSFTDNQKLKPNQLFNNCYRIFSRQETQKMFINLNPKQQSKWQWEEKYLSILIILINNYPKHKWVECPNQKTKTG